MGRGIFRKGTGVIVKGDVVKSDFTTSPFTVSTKIFLSEELQF